MKLVNLSKGALALDICPALGGSITAFRWRHPGGAEINLMRPMTGQALAMGNIEAASAFPLTPFSNRVRNGRFTFRGRHIEMPKNADGAHVEHGHGWQRPWHLESAEPGYAVLSYEHRPDDTWPFRYQMEQRFSLDAKKLTIDLVTRNSGTQAMPYGFGLHPYFVRTPKCTLRANVTGFWQSDSEVMPTRHIALPASLNLKDGLAINKHDLDNVFTGWDGRAEIIWPERKTRLAIKAGGPLGFLVIYAPPGEDYFCAEPVSNCTDAFNLSASGRNDTGLLVLEPDEKVSATVSFAPDAIY